MYDKSCFQGEFNYFRYSIHIDYGIMGNKTAIIVWAMVEFCFFEVDLGLLYLSRDK